MPTRCGWCPDDPDYIHYHDTEWGVPLHDDRMLFELLVLEAAQAGLSWITVLRKREAYRRAFDGCDPAAVAAFDDDRLEALRQDPGIIRNRRKIAAARHNARLFLEVQAAYGSFADYLWSWVDGRPVINRWRHSGEIPATTPLSDRLSADLRRRGFKFAGSTICYAYMQSAGLVMDHTVDCFRYPQLAGH